jgi:hydrogenase nickel incorporation protein HypB
MCATCGCSSGGTVQLLVAEHVHELGRDHRHPGYGYPGHGHSGPEHPGHQHPGHEHPGHEHPDSPAGEVRTLDAPDGSRTVELQQKVLAKNDDLAAANRAWLAGRGILAINLMSSPGAGKTTLLEATMRGMAGKASISVVEGDQETALDASRMLAAGSKVVQVNTGVGCHLDADMLARALRVLAPPSGSIVMIENVGNLVCPALFDLGEQARVVLASVTEGADKPLKYPHMFRQADLVLLNKTDLLPYVDFDVRDYASGLRKVAPDALFLQVSATTGDGMQTWFDWLRRRAPVPHD